MPLHSALVLENGIHTIVALRYANAAARIGAVGLATTDIGKVAQQSDDLTLWLLSAVTPAAVWSAVNTDSTASILSDAEDYADGAAAAAVAGIPDATAATNGLATAAQISKLYALPPDAQSAQQVSDTASGAASSAVSAIPDATTLVKGLATPAQIAKLANAIYFAGHAKTAVPVQLTSGATVTLLTAAVADLLALLPSSRYAATLGVRVTIWSTVAGASAQLSGAVPLEITTDGSNVATVTTTAALTFDESTGIATASAALLVDSPASSVTITGVQSTGATCSGSAEVWIATLEELA